MDLENFYHWEATQEIMAIIRRRNNIPETRRLVEQQNGLTRPGTLKRRYDHQSQKKTIFALFRPNKRSRQEIAEIDAELIRRANRIGGGYQPMEIEERRTWRNTGRRWNRAGSRDRWSQYNYARRQSTDRSLIEIQYRRQRSEIHSEKSYRRKSHHEQKGDRRSHRKTRVRVHNGSQNPNFKDGNWPRTKSSLEQHA